MTERLHPDDVQAIAALVAAHLAADLERLFGPRAAPAGELVDAAEVARRFGVTAEWVRDRAGELGAVRLGSGPRPRLRFDPTSVADRFPRSGREGSGGGDPAPRRRSTGRGRRVAGTGVALLPIEGLE